MPLSKDYKLKTFKQKLFLSNELKRALVSSFKEAKSLKTFVSSELLLYGLLTQSNGLASRLLCRTISNFRGSKINPANVCHKVKQLNREKYLTNLFAPKLIEFSQQLRDENEKTPWFSPEVKTILKTSILSSLKTNSRIKIISTKHLFFELLNDENVRTILRQISS